MEFTHKARWLQAIVRIPLLQLQTGDPVRKKEWAQVSRRQFSEKQHSFRLLLRLIMNTHARLLCKTPPYGYSP